jgi:hypothetical protein
MKAPIAFQIRQGKTSNPCASILLPHAGEGSSFYIPAPSPSVSSAAVEKIRTLFNDSGTLLPSVVPARSSVSTSPVWS